MTIYDAISSEREYQDRASADPLRPDMIQDFHIGDTLAAIQYNLNKAYETWYKGQIPHPETLALLRKIAALAVKAGEEYGMEPR